MRRINNYIVEKLHIDKKSATDSLIINVICAVCACHSEKFINVIKKFLSEKKPKSINDLEFIADAHNDYIKKSDEDIFKQYVTISNSEEIQDYYDSLGNPSLVFDDRGTTKKQARIWHLYRDEKGSHDCCVFEYSITYSGSGWTILIR